MSNTKTPDQVDVRGPRFAAWITTAVLVIALLVSGINPLAAAIILGVQSVVFAIGAIARAATPSLRPGVRQTRRAAAESGLASVNPFPR